MRNKIFGGVGVLWGSALIIRWVMAGAPVSVSSSYQNGQLTALAFGVLLLLAGLYYFFKKSVK